MIRWRLSVTLMKRAVLRKSRQKILKQMAGGRGPINLSRPPVFGRRHVCVGRSQGSKAPVGLVGWKLRDSDSGDGPASAHEVAAAWLPGGSTIAQRDSTCARPYPLCCRSTSQNQTIELLSRLQYGAILAGVVQTEGQLIQNMAPAP
jgi:hypothetical protein